MVISEHNATSWSRSQYCTPKTDVEILLKKWDESASKPPEKDEINEAETFEEPLL